MVELALHSLGRTKSYHALCETERALPDAVQILTPCTTGKGRLHVLSLGRFALTLFRPQNGKGVRIHLDLAKTAAWPHIRRWALQPMEGGEKELVRLEHEIRKAGISILSAAPVQMRAVFFMDKELSGPMTACISCGALSILKLRENCVVPVRATLPMFPVFRPSRSATDTAAACRHP